MTPEAAFLIGGLLSVLAFPLGCALGSTKGRPVVLHAANLLLCSQVLLSFHPHWVFEPCIARFFALAEPFLLFGPALLVLGVGRAALRRPRERRGVALLALAIAGTLLVRASWMILPIEGGSPEPVSGHHFCPQTLRTSCGPAAAVSLLSLHGVASTESEMVAAIRPLPAFGASFLQIWRGLDARLQGTPLRPRLVRADPMTLFLEHEAALVALERGHAVVVHRTQDGFVLLDPGLEGPRVLPADILARELGQTAIVIEGSSGPP